MTDIFSKEKRTEIMKQVRSKNNISTEIKMSKLFKKYGIKGWRRQYNIIGKPDFAFPMLKLALFIDGCFWHGHNCRNLKPKTNSAYWFNKIRKNKERDYRVSEYLKEKGWSVVRIWECKLKKSNEENLKNELFQEISLAVKHKSDEKNFTQTISYL
jgi:DNA mismatch endonuclease (patch repair protein)